MSRPKTPKSLAIAQISPACEVIGSKKPTCQLVRSGIPITWSLTPRRGGPRDTGARLIN